MNAAAAQYVARGRRYLAQASEELARRDLEQASDKGWGAASQLLKAAAAERNWTHGQHRQPYRIVRDLSEEIGDDEIRSEFAYAGELHTNFYEGLMTAEDVQFHLEKVRDLVGRVEGLLNGTDTPA